MNYTLNDNVVRKSDTVAGLVAVGIYILLLLLFVFFIRFSPSETFVEKINSSGVLINFGEENLGSGKRVADEKHAVKNTPKVSPKAEKAPVAKAKASPPQVIPNDNSENAVVAANVSKTKKAKEPKVIKKAEKKVKEVEKVVKAKPDVRPAEAKPVVNAGALYKKRNSSDTTNSENNSSHGVAKDRDGKSGNKDGKLGVSGGGGDGANFALTGRSLLGDLATPKYDERVTGQIIIEIQVDRSGKVLAATYVPKNSTISSRSIIEAVRKAAMKAKFNNDQSAAFTQIGTITYILKVE